MRTITILFFCCLATTCIAQRVVYDHKTTTQVATNSTTAIAKESVIKDQNEKSKKLQEKAQKAMAVVNLSKELYKLSMQNVKSFGKESASMVKIADLGQKIGIEAAAVLVEIRNNPKSTFTSYNAVQSLIGETSQSIVNCYNLIANGKFKLEIPGLIKINPEKDAANLIDPAERHKLLNEIITTLTRIYYTFVQIKVQLQYSSTWARVLQQTFPHDYFLVTDSYNMAQDIINTFY